MHAMITTTITTLIDLDTFAPSVDVDIQAEEGLPRELVLASVKGACHSLLKHISDESGEQ